MLDFRIENTAPGVRICFVKTDRFKTSKITMSMVMPLDGNTAAQAILPFYLHRSCAKYPDFTQLNGRLEELYGAILSANVSKHGELQLLNINLTAIDDRFALTDESISAECVKLITDLLFEPCAENGSFIQSDIEREKRLLDERRKSELDDKRIFARRRCEEIMCADEAYGLNAYGSAEQIAALTADDVYAAWKDVLRRSIIQFTIVSSNDASNVGLILKERFSAIDRDVIKNNTRFINTAEEVKYVNEEQPVKQGKLVMGFRMAVSDENDHRFENMIMADIYGGSPHSKLFVNVREKMSLCYYCRANCYRQKGIMFVESGIETENEQRAKEAILDQLEQVRTGDFSDEDLNASKMYLSDYLLTVRDTPESLSSWYSQQLIDENPISPETACEKISRVTREDIIESCKGAVLDTIYMLSGTAKDDEEA